MIQKIFDKKYEFPFTVYIPDDIKQGEKLPLIVFLHGAGERGDDNEKHCSIALPRFFFNGKGERVILVCPQCPDGKVWKMEVEQLHSFIYKVLDEYPVDRDAVTMSGISMGAYGTFDYIMTYPELICAAVCVCGAGDCWRANLIKDIPIRIYHGDKDEAVPVSNAYEIYDAIIKNGGKAELTVYKGVNHNSWDLAYNSTDSIHWLATSRKNK